GDNARLDDVRVDGAAGKLLASDDDAQGDLTERIAPFAHRPDLEVYDPPWVPGDLVDGGARCLDRAVAAGSRGVGTPATPELHGCRRGLHGSRHGLHQVQLIWRCHLRAPVERERDERVVVERLTALAGLEEPVVDVVQRRAGERMAE